MALDLEKQQSARKRKRKRTKIKLYLHEKVEVRIEEDGFQGSWHPGTVIACRRQDLDLKYEVKYDHILNDDESDFLVDQVRVSLSVDDTDCANEDRCNNRGLIRPPPPPFQFGKYGLPYGMCVDVHYQEAWWEGVIFDHDDGSEERKVFFPDLGDEIMARFNKLRVTQDWNEVEETWRQRGTWLFLVLIEEYEQKEYNPVSTKQLWHDLREKENFEKLGGWTSAVKALWRELVLEAIDDNLKVVANRLLQVTDIPDATQQPLQIAKPVDDVDINRKEDLVETHAMIPVENSLNDCLLLYPKSTLDRVVPKYSHDDKAVVCMHPQASVAIPSNLEANPAASSITSDDGFFSSNSNKINGSSPGPACIQSSWLCAGPDIVPGPDFCPDAIIKYAQMGNKKPRGTLIKDVRKHLLHQRWKIEFMKDKGKSRLRYTSPVGKSYHSLRQVCLDFCQSDNGILSPTSEGKQNSSHASLGDSSSLIEQQPKERDPTCCSQVTSSSNSDSVVYEPEYCHEAIVEWRNLWSKHGSGKRFRGKIKKADMSLRARKHLAALGWVFGYKTFHGRREIYHRSPMGRTYWSLRQAIKCILDEGTRTDTSRDMEMENDSCTDEGQFTSEKLSSAICKTGFHKQKNCSKESSCFSLSRKHHDRHIINVLTTRKARRKRKDSLHVETRSDAQNTSGPKSRCGITSRGLVGLQNDKKHTKSLRVLRSSKRVQHAVPPDPSHHNPRTVLSWLIDNDIVLSGTKVHYGIQKERNPTVEGRIAREGIKCSCCGEVYTLSGFELHAGSKSDRSGASKYYKPAASIFLDDGRSLLECQIQLMRDKEMCNHKEKTPDSLKESWDQDGNDHVCSVCHYGGELILCDHCPSSFHKRCLGMKDAPDGDWFCPSCCCKICGQNKLKKDTKGFIDGVLNCTQCEQRYHIMCLRNRGTDKWKNYPKGNWFCSKKCEVIFLGLQKLLGKPIPVGVDNLTWTLFKYMQSDHHKLDAFDDETLVETYSKLKIALEVVHECFEPVEEPRTGRDLMKDVIFSNGSKLNRLNFKGFYTILLEKNDELITVATVRIHGDKVAEIPLVGTRFKFRQLGMCRILMDVIEKLTELGVQRLILPAVPGVLSTWTLSFGFSKMTDSERLHPLEEIPPTLHDDVYGSGESIDAKDSIPVPEGLRTGQNEDRGILEQEPWSKSSLFLGVLYFGPVLRLGM
ncbi:hypothetical protein SADUNF_Sadunf09G0057400 [Salix dunnii]|uniref:PHD-type domain-containing protein n=1 Tax=Salix dunnii TaxID=1413687 RepID=A0A835MT57_9ROSI|nr:hypothetical protein SADUNF_Sadunf09G0057400 [Salix dunnii]